MAFRIAMSFALAAWLAAGPAQAAALTDAQARAFAQRQESAWNARDLDGYFALFTADARFTDQTRTVKGEMISYGSSDLAGAKTQSRKFLARATSVERGSVESVTLAADGRSARVLGLKTTTVTTAGRARQVCARTDQTLVLRGEAIRSKGQTDTIVRCGR